MPEVEQPEAKPTARCPGRCAGEELTVRQVMTSQTWVCQTCGRAWNEYEIKAVNP